MYKQHQRFYESGGLLQNRNSGGSTLSPSGLSLHISPDPNYPTKKAAPKSGRKMDVRLY
jgi:hypothetical protein